MLSATNKPFMPSFIMLNVIMMSVVMLNVVAPQFTLTRLHFYFKDNKVANKRESDINRVLDGSTCPS
jgi:hypothetical protein